MAAWGRVSQRMHADPTNGSEYFMDPEHPSEDELKAIKGVEIGHTYCDYCDSPILGVWDPALTSWYPRLGNMAMKPNVYRGVPIINLMRHKYGCDEGVWRDCPLLNLHSKVHSRPNDWSRRCHKNAIKLLCNKCFRLTYNRIKVQGNNGVLYSLSVIPSHHETVQSVMDELQIEGTVIGKGAINNY